MKLESLLLGWAIGCAVWMLIKPKSQSHETTFKIALVVLLLFVACFMVSGCGEFTDEVIKTSRQIETDKWNKKYNELASCIEKVNEDSLELNIPKFCMYAPGNGVKAIQKVLSMINVPLTWDASNPWRAWYIFIYKDRIYQISFGTPSLASGLLGGGDMEDFDYCEYVKRVR